jgi:hypothetical protein
MLAWILVILLYVLGLFTAFIAQGEVGSYLGHRWVTIIITMLWPVLVILGIVSVVVAAIKGD